MTRFIFFSKTMYSETPRIRHQLANLLISYGHKVIFYQRPLFFFKKSKSLINKKVSDKLEIRQTKQLIHHQLRFVPWVSKVNSYYEIQQVKSSLADFKESDVIINFNYDYSFLREVFPKSKIITLINDDFVAQAKFLNGHHVLKGLEETCGISDSVMVVSNPLAKQVSKWCNPDLFLPWADIPYNSPIKKNGGDRILLWAFINQNLDFDLLIHAVQKANLSFDVVGPIASNMLKKVESIQNDFKNITFHGPANLSELKMDEYFCSVIPYKINVPHVQAVTISNKTLQLMARGLPIVTYGMPGFYEHGAIFKSSNRNQFLTAIEYIRLNFESLQKQIEEFVFENQASNRFSQLQKIISR